VKGTLEAGAVVRVEVADAFHYMVKFGAGEFLAAERDLAFNETRAGHAAKIEDDLEQVVAIVCLFNSVPDIYRQDVEQGFQIVSYS
jgi:hypothetical protein